MFLLSCTYAHGYWFKMYLKIYIKLKHDFDILKTFSFGWYAPFKIIARDCWYIILVALIILQWPVGVL
jgi:hypothetical protein